MGQPNGSPWTRCVSVLEVVTGDIIVCQLTQFNTNTKAVLWFLMNLRKLGAVAVMT